MRLTGLGERNPEDPKIGHTRILTKSPGLQRIAGVIITTLILGIIGCRPGAEAAVAPAGAVPNPGNPAPPAARAADPGVFEDRIRFGQSAAFSGPARELGIGMRVGIRAAFAEANKAGGVHGRLLELTSIDDTYEPELAIANTKQLIGEEAVFALIGAVGTPTSRSAVPVATKSGVPYVGPFTGAAFLRDTGVSPTVVNLRASYNQETEEMVERLTTDLGIERIAVMYQDDSFGRAGYNGTVAALERRGMELAGEGLYPRNTTAVKTGLLDLRRGCPDDCPQAVILVGAYRPIAALIAWARHIGMDWEFIAISFVGSNALAEELGRLDPAGGEGVFVTQVAPFPHDDTIPVVAAYHRALGEYDPAEVPGFVSLEGYLTGRLAIATLELCGREISRDCFLGSLQRAEYIDLDGFRLHYDGGNDNQGSDTVFLTMIGPDGNHVPIETLPGKDR